MTQLDVQSPYDLSILETLDLSSEQDAMGMLDRAHALHQDRSRWLPAHERMQILEKAATLVAERAEELAMLAASEGGKPLADSRVEVQRGIEGIRVAIREMAVLGGEEVPMGITRSSEGRFAHTYREPRGVVLAISAFNHPFNLIVHQAVPAIAAGCPVLVKPALTTPLSCRALINILHEAGLPMDWCRMVLVEDAVATQLLTDPRMSFLTFIGSARVGWLLRSKLPPGATCTLEHGGLAPVLVDETADIEAAIAPLIKGGFYHAGQVCVSVQRIYMHERIAAELTERFVAATRKLQVGDPSDPGTEVGPLILPREVERVHGWVQEAVDRGGKLLCGGEKVSETCYAPTVVLDPPDDVDLSQKEVFGPVVVLYTYKELDDAVARANAPDVCFQASVFTKDLDRALDLSRRLDGMAVMVNDHTAFRVDWMPFGGHRQSGLGVGGIGYSIREMTLERMVVFKSAAL